MNEVNSYIESDNEINKSIEFENDEELYYSSYNPKASTSNQRLSNSKSILTYKYYLYRV
jgi:hypothetical protein